jgi:Big-like domain-containing protein
MTWRLPVAFSVLAAIVLAPAPGHGQSRSRYEGRYGKPVDVQISDLAQSPSSYYDQLIRTRGRLGMEAANSRTYNLQDDFGNTVRIIPFPEVSVNFDDVAHKIVGRQLEVVGVFQRISVSGSDLPTAGVAVAGIIEFMDFTGPPEERKGELKAPEVRLEALVSQPGKRDGQLLRVVGKFRGHNLYGDLPTKSQRRSADWVIKDDVYAVWVTGKKPKGSGWELDAGLRRDTGKWIEVIGVAETMGGVTYLKAERVALTTAPSATAEAAPPPPPPERPKVPPVVVFTLPLDGDREVPSDARFVVQFSKDMDEASFKDHVLVRYVGPRLPGDREFDGVKLTYDGGRRALTVDPGDVLRAGRRVQVVLLPGIVDVEGLTLEPRRGQHAQDAVDVVTYQIGI